MSADLEFVLLLFLGVWIGVGLLAAGVLGLAITAGINVRLRGDDQR